MTSAAAVRTVLRWTAFTRTRLILHAALIALTASVAPALAWATKTLLDALPVKAPILPAASALVALTATLTTLPLITARLALSVRHRVTATAVEEVFRDLESKLSLADLESPNIQHQLRVAEIAARDAPMKVIDGLLGAAQGMLTVALFTVALWKVNPMMALLLTASTVPLWLVHQRIAAMTVATVQLSIPSEREHLVFSNMLWDPQVAQETKLFGSGPALLDRAIKSLRTSQRIKGQRATVKTLWELVTGAGMALLLGTGLYLVLSNQEGPTPGEVTLFLAAFVAMQQAILAITDQASSANEGLLALRQSWDIVERKRQPLEGGGPSQESISGLHLHNIHLSYPGSSREALTDVSLHFPAGSMKAVVGSNGSGKTSLLKVAAGLYAPDSGSVLYGRETVTPETNDSYTAVFQEPTRYDLTATENITISDHRKAHDPIPAAQAVGLHERLKNLPQGYRTLLTRTVELGDQTGQPTYLSGGEWQRLATARALHRNRAEVLLLDEPAAHLDSQATNDALSAITAWMTPSRVVVMVTHRLDHARWLPRIVVLHEGKVAETGSHDELLARNGTYRHMWDAYVKTWGP